VEGGLVRTGTRTAAPYAAALAEAVLSNDRDVAEVVLIDAPPLPHMCGAAGLLLRDSAFATVTLCIDRPPTMLTWRRRGGTACRTCVTPSRRCTISPMTN